MKIKTEYILLGLLIVSSIAYLLYNPADRVHYKLPKLETLKADEITKIEITRLAGTTILSKKDKSWFISEGNYKADSTKISEILEKISDLKVTDLVSESKAYDRYMLDNKNRTVLKAYSKGSLKRELSIGKVAPTYSHTYIKLPGDDKIYLASSDLPKLFTVNASELRDMLVFDILPDDISKIEVELSGKKASFTREDVAPDKSQKETTKAYKWKNDKGEAVDKSKIDAMLSGLTKLYCNGYMDDALKNTLVNPVISIKLKGKKEYSLLIFNKAGENIPALSSESESPFLFPNYKYDTLKQSLEEIIIP